MEQKKIWLDGVREWMNQLGQVSLEDLAKRYSTKMDQAILATEKEKRCTYVGGAFVFSLAQKETFVMSMELYFQDEEKNWVQVKSQSDPVGLDQLTPASKEDILKKGKIAFDVEDPRETSQDQAKQSADVKR